MKGLTAIGLMADIVGVVLIFWASEKTKSPPYADAIRYWIFDKKVKGPWVGDNRLPVSTCWGCLVQIESPAFSEILLRPHLPLPFSC